MAEEKYGISFEVEGADKAVSAFDAVNNAESSAADAAFSYAEAIQEAADRSADLVAAQDDVLESNEKVSDSFLNFKFPDFSLTIDVWQTAKDIISSAGAALVSLAGTAIGAASEFEKVGLQMQATFGKSGGDAALQWANDFANATSLPLDQVAGRLKTIKAYSIDRLGGIDKVMTSLGDAAAATGGNFDGIARALGTMAAKGGVTFKNISQLMSQGVDVAKLFNDALGISAEQLENIDQLGLDGAKVSAALIDQLGKQYTGTMDQVHNSVEGVWFSIQDGFESALREISSGDAWQGFKDSLKSVRDALDRLWTSPAFKEFSKVVRDAAADMEKAFQESIPVIEKRVEELFSKIAKRLKEFRETPIQATVKTGVEAGKSFLETFSPTGLLTGFIAKKIAADSGMLEIETKAVEALKQEEALTKSVVTWKNESLAASKNIADFQDKDLLAKTKQSEEQKKLREQDEEAIARLNEMRHKRDIDLQKQALSEELKNFQDHQNEIKKEMEVRAQADKMYYDFRNDYALRSFKREQEDQALSLKRMQEDRLIAFQRSQEGVSKQLDMLAGGFRFSDLGDRLKEAMKATGVDLQSLVLPGDPFGGQDRIRKFLQDQERAVRRQQEDEERMLRRIQEDDLKRREFIQKQQTFWLEQNTRALIEQATSVKNMKIAVENRIKIIEKGEFERSFMREVFKRAKIQARIDGQVIAAP